MKTFISLLVLGIFFSINSCSAQETSENPAKNKMEKILIVYLSRTKNTEAVAKIIQQEMGGDLVALEMQKPYSQDYQQNVDQVVRVNETGFLAPLKTKIADFRNYDTIFIGFPTWAMQLPPPIKSFLYDYDFSGKKVIPFNTHAGYGVGSGFEQIKTLVKNAKVLKGFSTEGGYERQGKFLVIKDDRETEVRKEVNQWLKQLILNEE